MAKSAGTNRPIETYEDFWPYYLQEHAKRETRAVHYAGTAVAILSLTALIATGNSWFILAAVVGGYAFAWFGHFFIEKNKPATFTYPLWSLLSDFRMAGTWLIGRLGPELDKAGVTRR
ncbi:MAG: DUF962 domain-containing protein [Proteobacteria bacterium]|nr:DUF962 domain-containing protein [Pseudomonadota bacterium]